MSKDASKTYFSSRVSGHCTFKLNVVGRGVFHLLEVAKFKFGWSLGISMRAACASRGSQRVALGLRADFFAFFCRFILLVECAVGLWWGTSSALRRRTATASHRSWAALAGRSLASIGLAGSCPVGPDSWLRVWLDERLYVFSRLMKARYLDALRTNSCPQLLRYSYTQANQPTSALICQDFQGLF